MLFTNIFRTAGYPRYCTATTLPDGTTVLNGGRSRRGKPRGPPGSRELQTALKGCDDPLFLGSSLINYICTSQERLFLPIHAFIYHFMHWFTNSCIHLPIFAFIYQFLHSFTISFIHLPFYAFIYHFMHSFTNSLIHSQIHSYTYSCIH